MPELEKKREEIDWEWEWERKQKKQRCQRISLLRIRDMRAQSESVYVFILPQGGGLADEILD